MENDEYIDLLIKQFQSDLPGRDALSIFHKYITFGDCYAMNNDDHIHLREQVEQHFGIDANNVIVVGSAKLGFSI